MLYKRYLLKALGIISLMLIIIIIPCCGLKDINKEDASNTPNISSDNQSTSSSSSSNTDTSDNDNSESDKDDYIPDDLTGEGHEINYRFLFSGFTSVKLENREKYEAFDSISGCRIIWTNDDWFSFMNNYCPGIPYDDFPDFNSECIVYAIIFPAKPSYTPKLSVSSVKVYDNGIDIEYDEKSLSACYAINQYGICNLAIDILIINKSDLPDNLPNYCFYQK